MRSRDQRDQQTLDIGAALGKFAGLVLGGALVLYVADRAVGVSDDLAGPVMIGLVLVGVAAAIARLARRP